MSQRFWTVEIFFRDWSAGHAGEIRRSVVRNLTDSALKKLREDIFFVGYTVPDPEVPDTWELVGPPAIGKINITLQTQYFKD